MSASVQRNGEWWHQRDDGGWLRWNAPAGAWVAHATPPPPPPAPAPVAIASMPAPAPGYYGRPVAEPAPGADDYFRQTPAATFPSPLPISSSSAPDGSGVKLWLQIGVALAVAVVLGFVVMRVVGGSSAPSEDEVEAAFAPLNGYVYEDVPQALLDEGGEQIERFADGEDFTLGAKGVAAGTQPVGAVLIIGVEPEEIDESAGGETVTGFERASGLKLQEVALGGTTGYTASGPQGAAVFFLDQDGFVFFVIADNGNRALDIAGQLERANR